MSRYSLAHGAFGLKFQGCYYISSRDQFNKKLLNPSRTAGPASPLYVVMIMIFEKVTFNSERSEGTLQLGGEEDMYCRSRKKSYLTEILVRDMEPERLLFSHDRADIDAPVNGSQT